VDIAFYRIANDSLVVRASGGVGFDVDAQRPIQLEL